MEPIDPVLFGSLLEQLKQLTITLQDQQSFSSKWLPSIVGITAAVVAFIVGLLSFLSAREQIKTSSNTAHAQIKSAEEIAKSQLENAKEITISQIKANLVAASRKEWIENLRKNIAELFSLANKAHTDMHATKTRSLEDSSRMWHLTTYIELLLNPAEKEHQDFCIKQIEFISFCAEGNTNIEKWADLKADYLASAKIILKSEWNKVKTLT